MKKLKQAVVWILLWSVCIIKVNAQLSEPQVREYIQSSRIINSSLHSVADVRKFYGNVQYIPVWMNNPVARKQLLSVLDEVMYLGLDSNDYHYQFIQSIRIRSWEPCNKDDSLLVETVFTDAALHLFTDIAYGNATPQIGYNGLEYSPNCHDIPALLARAIDKSMITDLSKILEPASVEYVSIKLLIKKYASITLASGFKDVVVSSTAVSTGNIALINRLNQFGIDTLSLRTNTAALKMKVKELQQLFNLSADGIIRTTLLKEINVPLRVRIAELNVALNTVRWLNCLKSTGSIIVVNIPSANLLVYEEGKVVLESRIIVGKESTRTPTLTSKVTEVILYPYWMVPKSIATKELLPLIKKNPGYLNMNNMQVLNEHGKVVNPAAVNWNGLSTAYFPYTLRQSTGCDNSLGLVKLNFYNPYHVYLHDTPWKVLFSFNKRYFSHGCMRVEKAMELAHHLLKGNTIAVDTVEDKGCLRNQSPITVPTTSPMPVFVLYNTAWVDSTGTVQFNEDIYGRFSYLRRKPTH